jgi:hypothetical protein
LLAQNRRVHKLKKIIGIVKRTKKEKKEPIAVRRLRALMDHFQRMDHSQLVSFLNCWLKNSEVKYLCEEEGIKVD